ncbi:PKS-NRPS hybrid synthetase cheA-like [Euphorbia lathyris]|uniref:PKS-NRPS hybrid synthetase cheA-like n=1 Tax=Euphorbia lathyris TaxID=212925 RepID=UPI00331416E9
MKKMDQNIPEDNEFEHEVPIEDWNPDNIDYSSRFITDTVFPSSQDAIDWAKKIAIQNGFELVISSHKNGGKQKLLRCSRGERYRGVVKNDEDPAIRKSKTKACRCKFQIKAYQHADLSGWGIKAKAGLTGMHNHTMRMYPEGSRQMSGLSIASKQIVRDMSSAQAKPCAILAAVKEKHPEDNSVIKHIYNYRDKMRRDAFEGRDLASQFYHIAVENKYVNYTQADSGVITHVFMAHPESVDMFRTYHWYIGIDSTYKTNKYKMPFVEIVGMTPCNNNFKIAYAIVKDETEGSYRWILQRLKILLGDDLNPTIVVSDRELGLLKPIQEVFPQAAHLLCTWSSYILVTQLLVEWRANMLV